jgi:hypothetical protein
MLMVVVLLLGSAVAAIYIFENGLSRANAEKRHHQLIVTVTVMTKLCLRSLQTSTVISEAHSRIRSSDRTSPGHGFLLLSEEGVWMGVELAGADQGGLKRLREVGQAGSVA